MRGDSPEPARRQAIVEAIHALKLVPDAPVDEVAREIEVLLDVKSLADLVNSTSSGLAAAEIDAVLQAQREYFAALEHISPTAAVAIGDALTLRGPAWPISGTLGERIIEAHDHLYPSFRETLEVAGADLRRQAQDGKRADPYRHHLASMLALAYHQLTGRLPAKGRGESPFSRFVAAIFSAAGVWVDAEHLANRAADLHRQALDRK